MPRYIDRVARPRSKKYREDRNDSYRVTRFSKFVDPFPFIHGTLPEKMVYASLSRYGIPFLFLNDIHFEIPELEFFKDYQADFVIPAAKVIIEVQGAYFHSMQKTVEADAFKFAIYQTAGYKVLAWWDYDIFDHLDMLITSEPALMALAVNQTTFVSRELNPIVRTKIDTSKGIRTLNAKRALRKQYKKIIKYKGLSL